MEEYTEPDCGALFNYGVGWGMQAPFQACQEMVRRLRATSDRATAPGDLEELQNAIKDIDYQVPDKKTLLWILIIFIGYKSL